MTRTALLRWNTCQMRCDRCKYAIPVNWNALGKCSPALDQRTGECCKASSHHSFCTCAGVNLVPNLPHVADASTSCDTHTLITSCSSHSLGCCVHIGAGGGASTSKPVLVRWLGDRLYAMAGTALSQRAKIPILLCKLVRYHHHYCRTGRIKAHAFLASVRTGAS